MGEAIQSIDVTADSKFLIVAAITVGFHVYEVATGKKVKAVEVPGVNSKFVSLAFGEKQIMCLFDEKNKSYLRIYDFQDCLKEGNTPKHTHELEAPQDTKFNKAVWGPRNETIILATQNGKVMTWDV